MTIKICALTENIYQTYFDALIKGDRRTCQLILKDLLAVKTPVESIYEDLFKRSLYQVGDLWQCNRVSVATEHLVTALTESLLNQVYPHVFSQPRIGKSVVIACVANEMHALGAKMVADLFELHGWDSLFLGANVPIPDLLALIDEAKPDAIGLSLSLYANIVSLQKTLESVTQTFSMPVLMGGQAFCWGGSEILNQYHNTHFMPSSQDLIESFLKT